MLTFKKVFITILYFLSYINVFPQDGGKSVYYFLNLTNSARVASLGGTNISLNDNDLNFAFHNPALLNAAEDNNLVINYVNYFSDVNYGYVSYARSKDWGNIAGGLHYVNYGEFVRADEFGNTDGNFYASEYALNLMYSKPIDSLFTFGVNLKPVYSVLESYKSFGMVADAGVSYKSLDGLFSGGVVIRNIGYQIKPYYANNYESVPFEIQAGISKKLAHAPFRISLTATHLEKYDLTYTDPNETVNELFVLEAEPKESKLKDHADKLMRHAILGIEILPTKNFYFNLGYNYRRRQELKISTRSFAVGFSWGFGMKISKFRISYGRASYHLAGASNHFSLSTNLSQFYKKTDTY